MALGKSVRRTVYVGTFIYTPNPTDLSISHNTALGVDENGIIVFIERNISADGDDDIHDIAVTHGWTPSSDYTIFRPPHSTSPSTTTSTSASATTRLTTFFFPGLIDTHTHAPQYPNAGIFGSSTLLSWLQTYTFPLEASFSSTSRAHHVYPRVVQRSIANGTTAAAYYATVHVESTKILADVCVKSGQRALIGRVCMDRMSPEDYRDNGAEDAVEKTKEVISYCESVDPEGILIRPVITPRFAPSCSDECLNALGELHKTTGCFVQTHVSENMAEVGLVKELFPRAKHYVGVYEDAGLLSDKTVLAHAVHLSAEEIEVVARIGAGVSHCPVSNSSLTSGACRVRDLWDRGVKVGLGTDCSGGYSLSVLEVARQALLISRHVALDVKKELGGGGGGGGDDNAADRYKLSVEETMYLATRGGAAVIGLDKRVGAFEVGMEFDAMLVCLGHISSPEEGNAQAAARSEKPNAEAESADKEVNIVQGGGDAAILQEKTDSTSAREGNEEDEAEQVDMGPVDLFSWESWPDIVAKWVYGGDDRNVGAVWVKGRCVHKRGQIVR